MTTKHIDIRVLATWEALSIALKVIADTIAFSSDIGYEDGNVLKTAQS